jgi:diguanylate cyclase (GGDEF)-like protein
MHVVTPREREELSPGAVARLARAASAQVVSLPAKDLDAARRDYLEALPIAAAMLCADEGGRLYVDLSNESFRGTADWDASQGNWVDEISFFQETGIAAALEDFLVRGEQAYQFEVQDISSVTGRYYTVRLSKLEPTSYAEQRCLVALLDRTVQVETEKNLRAEMLRDSLSGLPNRLAFNERIEAVLADPLYKEGSYAVVVVDMTRFSRVNECVGALAGDELIITFARRLFSALRPGDVLARTGGDEFGILLRLDKGVSTALQFAERIKSVLATPFRLSEMEIGVDCAIGCALVTGKEEMAEEILRNAQFALKRSKGSGHIHLYEPDQAQAAYRRFRIETDLRRALEAGQLELAFQPLVELSTGRIAGFEALTRWDREGGEAIAPAEFIAVAEESGLILPLGRWALDVALSALASWDKEAGKALPLYVAVNLSAVQIQRDDVVTMVAEALKKHGIQGSRLLLELTESAIVHDPERACEVLAAMKDMNVRVALDDFGTGYTSLSYLQRLPVHMLKIDGSFVTNMLNDADSRSIVGAVLSLAKSLGLSTTAEGIEDENLIAVLRELGCTKGQGYFFSEPLSTAAALDYWASRSA